MLSVMGGVKFVTVCSFCTAYYIHKKNTTNVSTVRDKINNFFKQGEIYVTKGKYKKIYPKIQYICIEGARTTVVFTIPTNLHPDKIEKNLFILEHEFSDEIEVEKEGKKITLHMYSIPLTAFDYNYAEIKPHLKGMSVPIVAGKGRRGWVVYDIKEHPHLLIAGETGSGKSSHMRQIFTTLMLYYPSNKIHFYFADPMCVEFQIFENVAHTQAYETETKGILKMVKNLRAELTRRANLIKKYNVRHIDDLPPDEQLPYIIAAFDEFRLLMDEAEMKSLLEELGSAGRKCGMFLILACLRPDAQVVNGGLKQTLTVRMSFRQGDELNSRIALGEECNDAAKIPKKAVGRMIFKFDGFTTLQSPHLKDTKAEQLLNHLIVKRVIAEDEERIVIAPHNYIPPINTPINTPENNAEATKPKKRSRKKKSKKEQDFNVF